MFKHMAVCLIVVFTFFCSCHLPAPTDTGYGSNFKKGMTIFFMPPRNMFEGNDFRETLGRLQSIGVNTLVLVPYYFSQNENSDSIFPTAQTITDLSLDSAIVYGKQFGFNVILKPHIDLLNGKPRYTISPGNMAVWAENYKRFIEHYYAISLKNGLTNFVVGTELDNVADKTEFISIVQEIKSKFNGTLLYAASYDHFIGSKIWDFVDEIGVNAYFNLDNTDVHSINTMMDSWNYWLNLLSRFAISKNKPLIITEAGYLSREGAAKNPGSWERMGPPNLQEQADCYEALLSQAGLFKDIHGIFFWQWELGGIGGINNSDYTPNGKPAEDIIKKYWGGN
jgi:hypothetical protein